MIARRPERRPERRREAVLLARLGLACAALAACSDGSPTADPSDSNAGAPKHRSVWFEESAADRGLVFTYRSGATGELLMPEIMGGGAALLDADGDGDLDAYLVQGGGVRTPREERDGNRLFVNDGRGGFTDVPGAGGADDAGYGMGVAVGDADGDGHSDLYVTNLGADVLFANRGALTFEPVTDGAGLASDGWSTSAAFLDADADGDLDLYVTRYIVWDADGELACSNDMGSSDYCSPTAYGAPALDLYFENMGDGVFRDSSARAGVQAAAGNGLGVVCADFDRDGWIDVFVANDQHPDLLWRNRGDARFENAAFTAGVALDRDGRAKAGMGVAVSDLDADGDEDLLVCNLAGETDSVFFNQGGWFSDRTSRAGLAVASRGFTRFGVGWADFDHDGALDLFEANGRVMRRRPVYRAGDDYAEPNLLARGLGDGTFAVVPRAGLASELAATSRAAAFGDVDGDGAIDVLVVNRDAPAHLLLNRAARTGNAVQLAVTNAAGAPALGAAVEIRIGERTERREVRAAWSYLASSAPTLHVGLGSASGIDEVVVRWIDGTTRTWRNVVASAAGPIVLSP